MKIKKLTKGYIKKISDICVDSFLQAEYSYYLQKCNLKGLDAVLDFCSPENLIEKLQNENYAFFGAMEENTLVGVSAINVASGKILLLFVSPKYKSKGIGGLLLSHLIGIAASNNIKTILADSTHFGVGFYERFGFEKTGEEKILDEGMIYTPMKKELG